MRFHQVLAAVLVASACAPGVDSIPLILPENAKSLILLADGPLGLRGRVYDVAGQSSQIVSTELDLENSATVFALIYDQTLFELELEVGELREPASGEPGRLLPPPAKVLQTDIQNGASEGFSPIALPEEVATFEIAGPPCFPTFEPAQEIVVAPSAKLHAAGLTGYGITVVTENRQLYLVGLYVESLGRVPSEVTLGPMVISGAEGWFALSEDPQRLSVGSIGRDGLIVRSSSVGPGWSEPAQLWIAGTGTSTVHEAEIYRVDTDAKSHFIWLVDGVLTEKASAELPAAFVEGVVGILPSSPAVLYSTSSPDLLVFDSLEDDTPDIVSLPEGVTGVLAALREAEALHLITTDQQVIRFLGDPRAAGAELMGETGLNSPIVSFYRSGGRLWFVGADGRAGFASTPLGGPARVCKARGIGLGAVTAGFQSQSPASLIGLDSSGPDLILRRAAIPSP